MPLKDRGTNPKAKFPELNIGGTVILNIFSYLNSNPISGRQ